MLPAWLLAVALHACAADSFFAQPDPSGDYSRYYYEQIYEPFFAPVPGRPGFVSAVRPGANPAVFQARKPAGTRRVFIIGGSTAGGYRGSGDLGWGLSRALRGGVEVINCGMSGYNSDRERLVLKEILAFEPDAVVFLSGHNDFGVNASPLRPRWLLRAGARLARFGWFRTLRRLSSTDGAGARPTDRRTLERRRGEKLAHLLDNVRADARDCRAAGARPVFCLPPMDYEQAAPSGAVFPWRDLSFMKSWALFLRGQNARAAAAWREQAEALAPEQDELAGTLWSYAARAYARAGDRQRAREGFERALEAPADRDVCSPSCLRAIERAAKEEGADVADADAAFRRQAEPGMPGAALFADAVHWSPDRHRLVTRAVVEALRADPALRAWTWTDASLEDVEPKDRGLLAAAGAYHREASVFYAVQRAEAMPRVSVRALRWFDGARAVAPEAFASPEALLSAARAAYRSFDSRLPQFSGQPLPRHDLPAGRLFGYLGLVDLENGDCRGAARALALGAARPDADPSLPLARAAALALCGDRLGAAASLEAAERASLSVEAQATRAAFALPEPP